MTRRRRRPLAATLLLGALLAPACSGEATTAVETAEVRADVVVRTVAAPARIEPRSRQTVVADVAGEVLAVEIDDGDRVAAGDVVLRLASDGVDLAIEQATAAVAAAEALAGAAVSVDLSPLLAALRAQYDEVLPGLLDDLRTQAYFIADEAVRAQTLDALATLADDVAATSAALLDAERQARSTAASATAGQQAAAEAQKAQAELALAAAEDRAAGLTVVASRDGVVELGRATASADLSGVGGDTSGLEALLGGGGGVDDGPLAPGARVAAGQVLFTVYDLSGFHAAVTIDEVDVIGLRLGQRGVVLVDAYPDVELAAVVTRVAVSPTRGDTGGVVYPVQLDLVDVPDDVGLRVGLTASAEIVVDEVSSDTVIPSAALFRRDGREVVLVVRDGVVHVEPVRVVALGEETAAIDGAVESGEVVVTRGAEDLQDGDRL